MISIEAYRAFIGKFYNRLRHFANAQNVVSIRSGIVYTILLFLLISLLYLPILLHALFVLFLSVTIAVVFVNLVRFKHIDSCHFLELNFRGCNLNFLKLKQLLIDGDIESNPGPSENDCKSPVGNPKKIKAFKGTAKKCDLSENNVNVASCPKVQNCFFNTIQPVSLDIIKPRSVTCPSTLESLQKLEIEVNNDINSKYYLCQGDITKLNIDVIVNSGNKTLTGGGGIDGAIHEAAGSGLVDECQKLNACEIGECKVTLGYKLPAKYVFHIFRLREKMSIS